MKNIKIRYKIKNTNTGKVFNIIFHIKDIENLVLFALHWKVLQRDLFTDLHDNANREIYENDKIRTKYREDEGFLDGTVEYNNVIGRFGIRVGYRFIPFHKRGRIYELLQPKKRRYSGNNSI